MMQLRSAPSSNPAIENEYYRVECDATGRLLQIRDRVGGYDLIGDPRLADSFRLLVPLPDMEANYILGTEQVLTALVTGKTSIEMTWEGPLRNERGVFDIDVTLTLALVDDEVHFGIRVHNGTLFPLAEVWVGILGGMTGLGCGRDQRRKTEAMLPLGNKHWTQPLFSDFGNTRGQTLGVHGAEHSFSYPGFLSMPWISLYNPEVGRALYFAALEETPRTKLLGLSLAPGTAEGRDGGNWPSPAEVDGQPCGVTVQWTHLPYTRPGETFESNAVVLACHAGAWREAVARYREWFEAHYRVIEPGSTWIRRETATVHTMFMLPEDNINLRFADIPQWGKAARERGIGHVMIAGWNIGGHDRGYPYYEPDPRLGTWGELEAGIRACHDLELRVSFFVNCQPVDMTTDWYKQELHKYGILDPHGLPYYIVNYWGMGTLSARSRFINATPFTEISPAHPEVRKLLIDRMRRLIEIGADGLHIDKFFQTPMDFNPRLTWTSPDRAHHEGILLFVKELTDACRAVNPDFCFSYEGGWDRLFSFADTLWWGGGEDSLLKETFPQMTMISGVEQPYDFNKVNRAVLQGDNLLVGPANYNRGMDYPPMAALAAYIRDITRLRHKLLDVVSLGERIAASDGLLQACAHRVRVDAEAGIRWSVFRDAHTGRRAIILVNTGTAPARVRSLAFADGRGAACRVYQPPREPTDAAWPVTLELAGERAAFVIEDR